MTNTQQAASQSQPNKPARIRAVAYYRSTSGEDERSTGGADENSIQEQREQVRRWAEEHGVTIIREFVDHGGNAHCRKYRPAFQQMLRWIVQRGDFDCVLCLEGSRWDRWQKIDGLNPHEALCERHGKQLIFTVGQRSWELNRRIFRGMSH